VGGVGDRAAPAVLPLAAGDTSARFVDLERGFCRTYFELLAGEGVGTE